MLEGTTQDVQMWLFFLLSRSTLTMSRGNCSSKYFSFHVKLVNRHKIRVDSSILEEHLFVGLN